MGFSSALVLNIGESFSVLLGLLGLYIIVYFIKIDCLHNNKIVISFLRYVFVFITRIIDVGLMIFVMCFFIDITSNSQEEHEYQIVSYLVSWVFLILLIIYLGFALKILRINGI